MNSITGFSQRQNFAVSLDATNTAKGNIPTLNKSKIGNSKVAFIQSSKRHRRGLSYNQSLKSSYEAENMPHSNNISKEVPTESYNADSNLKIKKTFVRDFLLMLKENASAATVFLNAAEKYTILLIFRKLGYRKQFKLDHNMYYDFNIK